ncbi:hypothetical protein BCR33DRAFT_126605 [Rhizoclosmatium globosum]|uniref:Uncharacterized protein n=1 Tax=Rhizoclosmatium globosum TaxID=329046 RepID=A0A1Y2CHM8_9FUNG|nr:hypothetical protein BCR33DRAFT_126605 [Rhizoclosmatium globosum]|eukprot:ORY46334.1 hypothetical protein BCR33DRAFT_126605 [Rhizoclosmatium globosum]
MLTEALNHAPSSLQTRISSKQLKKGSNPYQYHSTTAFDELVLKYRTFSHQLNSLEAMESYSLSFPDIQESEQTIAAKNQITAFMTETASAEIELMALLDQCDERWPWWVNDVRRKFKETSANLVKAIEAFQKAQFGGMKDRIPWQLPNTVNHLLVVFIQSPL